MLGLNEFSLPVMLMKNIEAQIKTYRNVELLCRLILF